MTTFDNVVEIAEKEDGLVLLGCGGDANEWIEGVEGLLKKDGIAKAGVTLYKSTHVLTTTGGRTDIVLVLNPDAVDLGRLAIWRLNFGDCSWISDYIVNYASHHEE